VATNQFDADSYRRWRVRIPYSDGQIVSAIEQWRKANLGSDKPSVIKYINLRADSMISAVRRGYLSKSIYVAMLPFLVTKCAICSSTAHYRYGDEGRCREHRDVKPGWHTGWSREHDARNVERAKRADDFDQGSATGDRLRRLAANMKGRKR
jgi:hypothetical protein